MPQIMNINKAASFTETAQIFGYEQWAFKLFYTYSSDKESTESAL